MMDSQERARLEKAYAAVPEEKLMELILEGEADYEEGVYNLLLEEAKRRGIEDKVNAALEAETENIRKIEAGEEAPAASAGEELVPIMILSDEKDAEKVKSILEEAGIEVCIDSLSVRKKEFPASVMVPKSRVEESVALFTVFKTNNGVVLW